jgi:hypothetical protein
MKEILFEDLKKGDRIKHSHLGSNPLVTGIIKESPRQGRGLKQTILVDVKGSEVGMFDEIGSIYSNQIAAMKQVTLKVSNCSVGQWSTKYLLLELHSSPWHESWKRFGPTDRAPSAKHQASDRSRHKQPSPKLKPQAPQYDQFI